MLISTHKKNDSSWSSSHPEVHNRSLHIPLHISALNRTQSSIKGVRLNQSNSDQCEVYSTFKCWSAADECTCLLSVWSWVQPPGVRWVWWVCKLLGKTGRITSLNLCAGFPMMKAFSIKHEMIIITIVWTQTKNRREGPWRLEAWKRCGPLLISEKSGFFSSRRSLYNAVLCC